jgi:hypothetical protein
MSNIEDFAKIYAVPLILGYRMLIGPVAQLALANLVALIAMRLEYLGIMRAIMPEDRDALRLRRCLSDHWRIWIGHFGGERADDHFSKSYAGQMASAPTDKVGPEHCNVQVTTLVLGQLCTHSFYSPIPVHFGGYDGVSLCQIWPPQPYLLDSGLVSTLDDQAVLWLHEAFARDTAPMPKH